MEKRTDAISQHIYRMCVFELDFLFTLFLTLLKSLLGNSSHVSLQMDTEKVKRVPGRAPKAVLDLGSLNYSERFKSRNIFNLT